MKATVPLSALCPGLQPFASGLSQPVQHERPSSGTNESPPHARVPIAIWVLLGGAAVLSILLIRSDKWGEAFARWDLSHLHVFELADGRRSGASAV